MEDPLHELDQEARSLLAQELTPPAPPILLETPPAGMGERAFPCFGLAKTLRQAPPEIAKHMAAKLQPFTEKSTWIGRIEATGGYVNFHVRRDRLSQHVLEGVLRDGDAFGQFPPRPERVILEHTSANPNGPLHVGRARNPIIGDTLARILRKAGYKLETQYYLDDMGKQVALLAWGRKTLRSADLPPAQRDKVDHDLVRYYQAANERQEGNTKAQAEVQALMHASEQGDAGVLRMFEEAYKPVLDGMLESLRRIGVSFDSFQKESEFVLNGEVDKVIDRLATTPLSRKETDGALFLDLSTRGIQGRSQRFVYRRRDGTSLYATRDVAYHFWKAARADRLVNVLGEDHKLQAQQVRICLELLECKVIPEVVFYAFVSLPEGKMSTRRNRVVFLDDLVDEAVELAYEEVKKRRGDELDEPRMRRIAEAVGVGALRYNIVRVQPEKGIVFKWEEALNFEGASAPFLQYAHTRCVSILRKAGTRPRWSAGLGRLVTHPSEHELLYHIARLPRVVDEASNKDAPHLLAGYSQELAGALSGFYRDCAVLTAESATLRDARLLVVEAARIALKNTLDLLGIPAPDEM
ncbi:MAG TPA: arginine--tRNA ligase [Candidatus Thermoplasmatota archaeon]|nr:arginine--tRNA ligase [Candidatus Thermoplasmatota archaeon]